MKLLSLLLVVCAISVSGAENKAVDTSKSTSQVKPSGNGVQSADEDLIIEDEETLLPESSLAPAAVSKQDSSPKTNSVTKADSGSVKKSGLSEKKPAANKKEEELILEGGEEDILAGQRPQKIVQTQNDKSSKDTTTTTGKDLNVNLTVKSDTNATKETRKVEQVTTIRNSDTGALKKPKLVIDKPIKIDQMQSINFARNLKEYRSPKLAMLLSLFVPGAGQAYARNNLKTGLFGAVEVAVIGAGAAFGVKGGKTRNNAHDFADEHYSLDQFNTYNGYLRDYCKTLVPKDSTNKDAIYNTIFYDNELNGFLNDADKKNNSYYSTINSDDRPYIQGWDDVSPKFDQGFGFVDQNDDTNYVRGDTSSYLVYKKNDAKKNAVYGFSDNQKKYSKMLSKSNRYYRDSKIVFTLLIINHLASAIDAGFTAKAYNDRLLGKESFWHRINIEDNYVKVGDHTIPGYALQVKF